ncbi:MAG TPA: hypothetical protein VL326_27265 [Kofleriaceae bacterium]|jgi:hypothetical protein|nr:hypothetical protein [Kofleriaceae bacterium]
MSLFRKTPTAAPPAVPTEREREAPPRQAALPAPLFTGSKVDLNAIYNASKVTPDDLDRVVRADSLLHTLPKSAPHTAQIVDATLRAFGVDRRKIIEAAQRQLGSLEAFIRTSHEHTQTALAATAQRIAELEAEIERCRSVGEQATREGEDRARTVNNELVKVQRVLEFFENEAPQVVPDTAHLEDTTVVRPVTSKA